MTGPEPTGYHGKTLEPVSQSLVTVEAMVSGSFGGFGPSTRRFVEATETVDNRRLYKTKGIPPAVAVLIFVVGFIGTIYGLTKIYEGQEFLGGMVLVFVVAVIAFLVVRTVLGR
jgi:hypothetical protein